MGGFYAFFIYFDVALHFLVYQVGCAVWAVDFSALADFAISYAADFLLGAAFAVT